MTFVQPSSQKLPFGGHPLEATLEEASAEEDFGKKIGKLKDDVSREAVEKVINSALYCMREHADTETKQPLINLIRQFIQKVVIGKTPGRQPASLEVHGRIASILAAMEAATILEKQFEALMQSEYLERRDGELDTQQKQKSSSTRTRRSFWCGNLNGRICKGRRTARRPKR